MTRRWPWRGERRRRDLRTWTAASVLVLAACTAGAPGSGIDTTRAMQHVAELVAIGPRPGDSPAAQRAAAYIEQALATAGLHVEREPVGKVLVPGIELGGLLYRAAREVTTTDPNLVVRFGPQTGAALLVMAHYDTVPPSPGAADNAAAVGVLIELARVLAASPPHTPVILAFTANEEIGLVGCGGARRASQDRRRVRDSRWISSAAPARCRSTARAS